MYDNVLRLKLPEGITTIAFADNLAIVSVAKDKERVKKITNTAIEIVKKKGWKEKS